MVGCQIDLPFWQDKNVLVTGGAGFLGSSVVEKLRQRGVSDRADQRYREAGNTDLRRMDNCEKAVKDVDIVIHLAARVGGIGFNRANPATLFYDNAMMGIQLMEAARLEGVEKFTAVGTVCAYPKYTPVPFREEDLWNGYPEETNAPYGLAKKMLPSCNHRLTGNNMGSIRSISLPVNLYGPRDNFNPDSSACYTSSH